MNLAKNLEMSAFYFPEHSAISEDPKQTSYAILNERANRVATALLKTGIAAGDHVALCAPNSGDWLAFYFGVIKTKFFSVPTIYVRLLTLDRLKEILGDVRYCFSAAASMAAETVHQWKARTGLSIYEGYGMTEAAPTVAYNHRHRHVIGSVGTAVPGVEIQIREENGNLLAPGSRGEVCVRGPNIMKGYYDNAAGTRAAFWPGGWFRSGDVGVLDDNSYLFIVDRLKDMIISGGENVYSLEVEEVLYAYPEVQECAVIGTPDKEWGESVTAFILPKPGRAIDQKELKDFLKARLSAYKVPKRFFMVDDFPRSPAGKLLKRKLRDSALEGDDLDKPADVQR